MLNYKRVKLPAGHYFFAVVTFNRQKFLTSQFARKYRIRCGKKFKKSTLMRLKLSVCFPITCTADGDYHRMLVIIKTLALN